MTDLLGQWFLQDNEGNFEAITVIEVSDGLARAIGKNIPVDELTKFYVRKEAIAADPFALVKDMSNIDSTLTEAIFENVQAIDVDNTKKDSATSDLHIDDRTKYIQSEEIISPEHELIRNAIKLAGRQTSITLSIEHSFPFDIDKIRSVAKSLDINPNIVAEVIMSNIKNNPEKFFDAISSELVRHFSEPECACFVENTK